MLFLLLRHVGVHLNVKCSPRASWVTPGSSKMLTWTGKPPSRGGQQCSLGDIFLSNEVHAVPQRRHQADSADTIEAGEHLTGKAFVQVADRDPVELGKL